MNALTVILATLSMARLTRFVTTDKIFERPRDWVLDRIDPDGMLTYLLGCPWCVSVYLGAGAAPIFYYWGETPYVVIPALALTASYVSGFLATFTER